MSWLWWIGVAAPLAAVFYTYAGYPILIWITARLFPRLLEPASDTRPQVALVVANFNGLHYLPAKLESLQQQNYPAERIEIIVVDDGSDDGSVDYLKSRPEVTLLEVAIRQGKPHALNRAREYVQSTSAQVAVLTDVRQPLSSNTVADLTKTLSDPDVGVAGGELVQVDAEGGQAPIGLYWRYEKAIRIAESEYFSTVGVSGALYAIAVSDWPELQENTILDDVEIPITTLRRGQRSVLVPGAIARDRAEKDISGEWRRKVRTLTGNYQTLMRNRWLLNPLTNRAWWQFVSHKLMRLVVPWALLMVFASSLVLTGPVAAILLIGQLAAYLLALTAIVKPGWVKWFKPAALAGTFVALNAAAVVALYRYLTQSFEVTWKQASSRSR